MKSNILAIAIVAACLGTIACDDATVPTEPSSFKNELDFTPLVLPRLDMVDPSPVFDGHAGLGSGHLERYGGPLSGDTG